MPNSNVQSLDSIHQDPVIKKTVDMQSKPYQMQPQIANTMQKPLNEKERRKKKKYKIKTYLIHLGNKSGLASKKIMYKFEEKSYVLGIQ